MLGNSHFYNRTIRKIVVAFGTMFNDLVLVRYDRNNKALERTRVPLSYGPKEKYLTRLTSDPNLTKSILTYVPRMSFDLTSVSYDNSRKLNTLGKNYAKTTDNKIASQYNPVPYNFEFDLSIFVRNTEDGTQILEQILPFFTPDFTVTVDFINSIGRKYDMPVILNSVTSEVDYEGDMSTTRLIIWNLSFTAKAYIYPAVNIGTDKIIRQANTYIYSEPQDKSVQKVYVDYENGTGVYVTGETIRTKTGDKTGTVTYFANNVLGELVISEVTDLFDSGEIIVGDYSGATYTIDTVDLNPIKSVTIIVKPDPVTANVGDDFGFTETITEYPDNL